MPKPWLHGVELLNSWAERAGCGKAALYDASPSNLGLSVLRKFSSEQRGKGGHSIKVVSGVSGFPLGQHSKHNLLDLLGKSQFHSSLVSIGLESDFPKRLLMTIKALIMRLSLVEWLDISDMPSPYLEIILPLLPYLWNESLAHFGERPRHILQLFSLEGERCSSEGGNR
jgi:hypothetical protein